MPDEDGSYGWYSDSPPTATYARGDYVLSIPVAGLWGGSLAESTVDGWVCRRTSHGVELIGPLGDIVEVTDGEEWAGFCGALSFQDPIPPKTQP
ncbi:MAG: hypothetical protein WAL50_22580 [Kineosporiaceae bacterium]